jgi:hypothetical protein
MKPKWERFRGGKHAVSAVTVGPFRLIARSSSYTLVSSSFQQPIIDIPAPNEKDARKFAIADARARIAKWRPTRYGNPFVVRRSSAAPGTWEVWRGASLIDRDFEDRCAAASNAVKRYRRLLSQDGVRRRAARDLRGFNLACWCKAGEPCHADVLLEFANADESGA